MCVRAVVRVFSVMAHISPHQTSWFCFSGVVHYWKDPRVSQKLLPNMCVQLKGDCQFHCPPFSLEYLCLKGSLSATLLGWLLLLNRTPLPNKWLPSDSSNLTSTSFCESWTVVKPFSGRLPKSCLHDWGVVDEMIFLTAFDSLLFTLIAWPKNKQHGVSHGLFW